MFMPLHIYAHKDNWMNQYLLINVYAWEKLPNGHFEFLADVVDTITLQRWFKIRLQTNNFRQITCHKDCKGHCLLWAEMITKSGTMREFLKQEADLPPTLSLLKFVSKG